MNAVGDARVQIFFLGGLHDESVERESITGVWGKDPAGSGSRAPGQGVRGRNPLKQRAFLFLDAQPRDKICPVLCICQKFRRVSPNPLIRADYGERSLIKAGLDCSSKGSMGISVGRRVHDRLFYRTSWYCDVSLFTSLSTDFEDGIFESLLANAALHAKQNRTKKITHFALIK